MFKNVHVCYLGGDNFPAESHVASAHVLNDALETE
jgi:hypothetical protein